MSYRSRLALASLLLWPAPALAQSVSSSGAVGNLFVIIAGLGAILGLPGALLYLVVGR